MSFSMTVEMEIERGPNLAGAKRRLADDESEDDHPFGYKRVKISPRPVSTGSPRALRPKKRHLHAVELRAGAARYRRLLVPLEIEPATAMDESIDLSPTVSEEVDMEEGDSKVEEPTMAMDESIDLSPTVSKEVEMADEPLEQEPLPEMMDLTEGPPEPDSPVEPMEVDVDRPVSRKRAMSEQIANGTEERPVKRVRSDPTPSVVPPQRPNYPGKRRVSGIRRVPAATGFGARPSVVRPSARPPVRSTSVVYPPVKISAEDVAAANRRRLADNGSSLDPAAAIARVVARRLTPAPFPVAPLAVPLPVTPPAVLPVAPPAVPLPLPPLQVAPPTVLGAAVPGPTVVSSVPVPAPANVLRYSRNGPLSELPNPGNMHGMIRPRDLTSAHHVRRSSEAIVGIDYCQFSVGCKPDTGGWSAGSWKRFVLEKQQLGICDTSGWVDCFGLIFVLRLPLLRLLLRLPLRLPLRRLSVRGFYGLRPVWAPAKITFGRPSRQKCPAPRQEGGRRAERQGRACGGARKLPLETPSEDVQDDISVLTEALAKLKVKKEEGWAAKVKRYVASWL
ncbi:MAG: hypothetical protein Q9212_002999 [Teloschistes hypoglaucus]